MAVEGFGVVWVAFVGTPGMTGVISPADMSWAVGKDIGIVCRPT